MLQWEDGATFTIGGTTFRLEPRPNAKSTRRRFPLIKPRWMLDRYLDLAPTIRAGNVFELGINQGGSTAFLAYLLEPRKFVTIDITAEPVEALSHFIDEEPAGAVVTALYGVDQSDRARLERILDDEFGEESLDVVIDDASHQLEPTTASFNTLFPRLRAGGLFIIEDWSWVQRWEHEIAADPDVEQRFAARIASVIEGSDRPFEVGLAPLVLQLVLAVATAPDVIADVSVHRGLAVVTKGPGEVDRSTFALADIVGDAGSRFLR